MNDLEERERLLDVLREQIRDDEEKLRQLNESMEEIRRDIHDFKRTIEYLRGFTS